MLVKREENSGIIECLFKSSNILASRFDLKTSELEVIFNYGGVYKYSDVLMKDYVRFEISESQGTTLSKYLKKYKTEKLTPVNVSELKNEVNLIIEEKNRKNGLLE